MEDKIDFVAHDPFNQYFFATGTTEGNVKRWDMRKPNQAFDACFTQSAGQGVTFLDWHPNIKNKMLTSGNSGHIYCHDVTV